MERTGRGSAAGLSVSSAATAACGRGFCRRALDRRRRAAFRSAGGPRSAAISPVIALSSSGVDRRRIAQRHLRAALGIGSAMAGCARSSSSEPSRSTIFSSVSWIASKVLVLRSSERRAQLVQRPQIVGERRRPRRRPVSSRRMSGRRSRPPAVRLPGSCRGCRRASARCRRAEARCPRIRASARPAATAGATARTLALPDCG